MVFRPPMDRPAPDIRDDEEKAEVSRILSALPADHAARLAHQQGVDTISLSHLVGDAALIKELTEAVLKGRGRLWGRHEHFKP